MSQQLKASIFNAVFADDIYNYVFNSSSGAIACCPKTNVAVIAACKPNTILDVNALPATLVTALNKHGFLLDANHDEYTHQHNLYKQAQQQPENALYCIAPTMRCNLKCSYCFEKDIVTAGAMTANVQAELVQHFTNNINDCTAVAVQWFGGEPLLGLDIIENLTEKFVSVCEQKHQAYFSEIVSNGVLLQKIALKRLAALKLASLQLTLDGNITTYAKRKGMSYAKAAQWHEYLFTHLHELLSMVRTLTIRINVDHQNFTEALYLVDTLAQISTSPQIRLQLGFIGFKHGILEQLGPEYICFNKEEVTKHEIIFMHHIVKQGFHINYPMAARPYTCSASRRLAFVIDSEGFVGNCEPEIGQEYVKHNRLTTPIADLKFPYIHFDPYVHSTCQGCTLIPVCLGECPRGQFIEKNYACRSKESIVKKIPIYFDIYAAKNSAVVYDEPGVITIIQP